LKFINAHHIEYIPEKWLSYDDVCLMPLPSNLDSRNDPSIDLSTNFTKNLKLKTPILSANMDSVTGADMVIALAELGSYGVLHRFYASDELFYKDVERVYQKTNAVAFSVGANPEDLTRIDKILDITGGNNIVVVVDVAHGHLSKCINQVKRIRNTFGAKLEIIAGNVVTPVGVADLIQAGVSAAKIGIGNGSHCSTRVVTGFGCPQLSAIMSARKVVNSLQTNVAIIADGGIRDSGDIVKALAAGADTVMVGGLFAACEESPGDLYVKTGDNYEKCTKSEDFYHVLYKKYRGQSSLDFLNDIRKTNVSIEGEHSYKECQGSVKNIARNLINGIRSGMTYAGASNLEELSENAIFMELTHHGYIEGTPHGKSDN